MFIFMALAEAEFLENGTSSGLAVARRARDSLLLCLNPLLKQEDAASSRIPVGSPPLEGSEPALDLDF